MDLLAKLKAFPLVKQLMDIPTLAEFIIMMVLKTLRSELSSLLHPSMLMATGMVD